MFYDTRTGDHGLPRNPFKACVVPRPIGWITTLNEAGRVNLAPYSFFNGVAGDPPVVMFAAGGRKADGPPDGSKDSLANAERTKEFVCNVVTWDLREQMNMTSASAPAGTSEAEIAGLELVPSELVKPPRVAASPIHLECSYLQTVDLPSDIPDSRNAVVFGQVIGIHIDDSVLTDGLVDMAKVKPIARLGYMDYCLVEEVFTIHRPDWLAKKPSAAAE
ncbi:flavin reductase family protein [Pelagibius sp. CAU 1746]|uniref:flavin reductase family protein n=1 Tax=Pelagibius sp. CAU 1746 TaxID=3140370 RepID=UPI00325B8FC8